MSENSAACYFVDPTFACVPVLSLLNGQWRASRGAAPACGSVNFARSFVHALAAPPNCGVSALALSIEDAEACL